MGLHGLVRTRQAAAYRLETCTGPWQGTVVLPVHLTWYQLREFDVAKQKPRLLLYNIVICQGRRNYLAASSTFSARRLAS